MRGRRASYCAMGHEAPVFALLSGADAPAPPGAELPVDRVVRSLAAGPRPVGQTAQARFGLGELPGRVDRLAAGMIYGVACDEQAVRLPLVAGALAASLRAGKQCVLLTPSEPGILLRKFSLT